MTYRVRTGNALALMRQIGHADLAIGVIGLAAAAVSIWADSDVGGILGAGLALLMLAIAVADFRYFIIPNELTAAAAALAVINAAVGGSISIVESVATATLRGLATMLFFMMIRKIYGLLRGREGIGLGDVKLAFVAGAWLDLVMIPVAIEIAALAALTAYIVWQIIEKRTINSTSRLPFGLFFAPSVWLSWLLGKLIFAAF